MNTWHPDADPSIWAMKLRARIKIPAFEEQVLIQGEYCIELS